MGPFDQNRHARKQKKCEIGHRSVLCKSMKPITVSALAEAANVGRTCARRFLALQQPGQPTKDARLREAYERLGGRIAGSTEQIGEDAFATDSRG
jgi:hypothetical protein